MQNLRLPFTVVLGLLLCIAGCAPAIPAASEIPAEAVIEAVAPANIESPNSNSLDSNSPISSAPSTRRATDGRAGGQLQVLEAAPTDRTELILAYAEAVRDQPFAYGDVGAVLEALAVEGMQRIYPAPTHEVVSGIEYADASGRTLGELDIVVFLRGTGDALMVSEVKLSGNLKRAASKADSQIYRFRTAISNGQVATMRHKSQPAHTYSPANFENVLRYGKVGSRGALAHEFDWEIDLTRDEGDKLQQLLLQKPSLQP